MKDKTMRRFKLQKRHILIWTVGAVIGWGAGFYSAEMALRWVNHV